MAKTTEVLIISPLYIDLPRVRTSHKRVYLNMNAYGNTNTFTNNEVKKAYLEAIREQIEGLVTVAQRWPAAGVQRIAITRRECATNTLKVGFEVIELCFFKHTLKNIKAISGIGTSDGFV